MFRELKCPNILLCKEHNPKLVNFGVATVGSSQCLTHEEYPLDPVLEFYPPESALGFLTFDSEVHCLGVLLLQLITGREVFDPRRDMEERVLLLWQASSEFEHREKYPLVADPLLEGQYPREALPIAFAIAERCTYIDHEKRPHISGVVKSLETLASLEGDFERNVLKSKADQEPEVVQNLI